MEGTRIDTLLDLQVWEIPEIAISPCLGARGHTHICARGGGTSEGGIGHLGDVDWVTGHEGLGGEDCGFVVGVADEEGEGGDISRGSASGIVGEDEGFVDGGEPGVEVGDLEDGGGGEIGVAHALHDGIGVD